MGFSFDGSFALVSSWVFWTTKGSPPHSNSKHNYLSVPCSVLFLFGCGLLGLWDSLIVQRSAEVSVRIVRCLNKRTKPEWKALDEMLAFGRWKQETETSDPPLWRETQRPKGAWELESSTNNDAHSLFDAWKVFAQTQKVISKPEERSLKEAEGKCGGRGRARLTGSRGGTYSFIRSNREE